MKFTVTMKDPDTLTDAIADAVKADVKRLGLSDRETAALIEIRVEEVGDVACRWFEYGEYLAVEIDTEAKTCTVLEVRR